MTKDPVEQPVRTPGTEGGPVSIQVDLTRCVGFGQCCFAAPVDFRMTGEESLAYNGAVPSERLEQIRAAAAACPVQAITYRVLERERPAEPAPAGTAPRIVIVGASLAGLRAAEAVRATAPDANLTIIDAEMSPAYDRPPLSKALLAGRMTPDQTRLAGWQVEASWKVGKAATGIDLAQRCVLLSDGERVPYDRLVIASGAHSRPWPDAEAAGLRGVFTLRSLADAVTLRESLARRPGRVCIIGAGFIGTEVASTCRTLGLEVTVLERGPLPLVKALGAPVGKVFADLLRSHGVDLRLGVEVKAIRGTPHGSVSGVELADGAMIDCEVVVVALGAVRNTAWLKDAGLMIDERGIATDEFCRVLDQNGDAVEEVFAAGDVTAWPSRLLDGERVAVEHWSNALKQGTCAGRNAAGGAPLHEHDYMPTFWSSQFGVNIKSAGLPGAADSFQVVQGSLEAGRFAALYGRAGRTIAAVTTDHGRHMAFLEGLVRDRKPFPQAIVPAVGPHHLNR